MPSKRNAKGRRAPSAQAPSHNADSAPPASTDAPRSTTRSALAIIATNAIPLLGAAFYSWNVWYILFLYWIENVAAWIITTCKVALCTGPDETGKGWGARLEDAFPFAFLYGWFTFIHGFFVFFIGGFMGDAKPFLDPSGVSPWVAAVTALLIVIGDFYQFFVSYFVCRDGRGEDPFRLQVRTWARMVVMHCTLIFGGFATVFANSPASMIVVLVALKTAVELSWMRRSAQTPNLPQDAKR